MSQQRDELIAFEPERSCSDCTDFAPVSTMITTPAGNVICPRCNRRRQKLAANRAQLALFGQRGLFT
jgi:Zn finger protein HypA/HybF involved in hydrogenase expression